MERLCRVLVVGGVLAVAGCAERASPGGAPDGSGADGRSPAGVQSDASFPIDGERDLDAGEPPNDAAEETDRGRVSDGARAGDAGSATDSGSRCNPEAMPNPNLGLEEDPDTEGCPAGMVLVDGFCIDRYEANLAVVNDGGTLTSWSPYVNPGDRRVRALSVAGAVPQGYVNGVQAAAACAEAGKRLCDDEEWMRACQGASMRTFPYGETREPGACNDERAVHPAVEYFGTSDEWIWSMLDHPCLNQLPDGLAPTGSHDRCVGADGPFDMMGNLQEWTVDSGGMLRGGFYVDTRTNGDGCLYVTTAHPPDYHDYSTGFRCCADPTGSP